MEIDNALINYFEDDRLLQKNCMLCHLSCCVVTIFTFDINKNSFAKIFFTCKNHKDIINEQLKVPGNIKNLFIIYKGDYSNRSKAKTIIKKFMILS